MVRTPQGEETLFAHGTDNVCQVWPGNEVRRLGYISSFTARRICAIPVDRGGSMSAVSAALLQCRARLERTGPERKAHKSQRGAVHASPGDVRDPTQRAGFNSGCDAVALS